ncbi:MAG: hypothetical protein R3246_01185 [Acidimicrobiia bacterium]|nr:hypothetical protein [Acidimicrobiia bacterium]
MIVRGDFSVDMFNLRRAVTSFLVGALLLVSVGAQASAVQTDTAALAVAERGLALGLQAADDIEADAVDGVLEGAEFAAAQEALATVIDKLEAKLENPKFRGRGPERALEVHQALRNGKLPSEVKSESDRIPGLAHAYGHLRAQLRGEGRGQGANPPASTP